MKIPMTRLQVWFSIIAVIMVPAIIILIWQSDKWYDLYTKMVVRVSREPKSKEAKLIEKSARYDDLPFEPDLTLDQHNRINDLTKNFKQILILFAVKSLYAPDLENVAQEMYAAERDPRGRDRYSRYQSRKGYNEEIAADSMANLAIPKIIFRGADTIAVETIDQFSISPFYLERDLALVTQFGVRKIIFDLRDNQGGEEGDAILALKLFMRGDNLGLIRRDRDGETLYDKKYLAKTYNVSTFGEFRHLDQIAILVNKNTASAAEVFVWVMQKWGYCVVGQKTFGKGVGQHTFYLPSYGSLFILTTREFLFGEDRQKLDGVGVKPNILVRNSRLKDSSDFQLEAAIKFLQNKSDSTYFKRD